MPTLENIKEWKDQAHKKQKEIFKELELIRSKENPAQEYLRRIMRINWNKELPILECQWHIDNCFYDGNQLKDVFAESRSSVLGGAEFGPSFIYYYIFSTLNLKEQFEQCPKCKMVYRMGPSSEQLERIRTLKPTLYADNFQRFK